METIFKLSNLIVLILVVYLGKSFLVEPTLFDHIVVILMSLGFFMKLKLEKEDVSNKQQLLDSIAQYDKEIKEKLEKLDEKVEKEHLNLKKIQEEDRLAVEQKISTLSLAVQRPQRSQQERTNYGWTK